jgi:DNA-binding response OmpR family regulator
MATILLVDGDRRYRAACSEDLQREGHRVLTASSGFEALQLFAEQAPEAVVTEVHLPGRDGIELICQLLDMKPRPIVVLNSESSYHRDSFLSWAADADLRKTSDTSELRVALAELLKKRVKKEPVAAMEEAAGACA